MITPTHGAWTGVVVIDKRLREKGLVAANAGNMHRPRRRGTGRA